MVVRSISITLFLFALLVDRAFGVDCSFDRINLTAICKNVKDLREISNQIQSNWIRLVIENTVGAVVDVPENDSKFVRIEELDLTKAGSLNLGELGFQAFNALRKIVAPNGTFSSIESKWFGENNNIEYINFSWNWFRRVKRKYFSTLKNLRVLNLSGNDINTIEVNTFIDNPNLDSLDVSDNWLDGLIDMGAMPRLRHFDASNNDIIDIPNNIFNKQPSLVTLSLGLNSIQRIRDRAFAGLNNLHELNLSSNSLTEINIFAYNHKTLQVLDFNTNDIEEVKANTFSNLRNLRNLDVSNNSIRTLDEESFRGLLSLRTLRLNRNSLVDLPPGVFAELSQIESIDLSYNGLQSFNNTVFGKATIPLRILDLKNNSLTLVQPQTFLHTPNLEYLSLAHNKLKELYGNMLENVHLRQFHIQYNLIEELPASLFNDLSLVKEFLMDNNRLTFLPDGRELLNVERWTVEGNPWQCPCLNVLFKFITVRHIDYRLNKSDYYDGGKPICIVTPLHECIKDIQWVRKYQVVQLYEGRYHNGQV